MNSDDFNAPFTPAIFVSMMIATLLAFSMTTSQALLPVVLGAKGFAPSNIGYAMSLTGIPVLVFGLISGILMSRYGAMKLIVAGCIFMLCAHLSYEIIPKHPLAIFGLRFAHGIGLGLFLPAIIGFAKSMLKGNRALSLFGIFTAAIPGANLIGPTVGEFYFDRFGADGFFLVTGIAGLLGLALLLILSFRVERFEGSQQVSIRYFGLATRRSIILPLYGMIFVGLSWGYVISFVSSALNQAGVAVSVFFVSLTIAFFVMRFCALQFISTLDRRIVALSAISTMLISLICVTLFPVTIAVAVCGIFFGIGYSVSYPLLSMWAVSGISEKEKPQVVALTNSVFNFNMFLAPFICGVFLQYVDVMAFQFWFSLLLLLAAAMFYSFFGFVSSVRSKESL